MCRQRELRSPPARSHDVAIARNPPSCGVTSSASAVQLPAAAFQRPVPPGPPRYSASTSDFNVSPTQTQTQCQVGGVSVRPKDVAHRGSLLSLAVLLAAADAARRPSCPHILDDPSTVCTLLGEPCSCSAIRLSSPGSSTRQHVVPSAYIRYRNSVCPSVCHDPVPIQAQVIYKLRVFTV